MYYKVRLSEGDFIWDWGSRPPGLLHGPFSDNFLDEKYTYFSK